MQRTRSFVVPVILSAGLATACVSSPQVSSPSPEHGFEAVGTGIGYLILSPLLIAAGLIEGVATLPYFLTQDLHALNRGMVDARADVDMDRTYRYAYQQPLADVPVSGDTGDTFRDMGDATAHFQRVLAGYGVAHPEHYLLTAVRTADREGYTLYAVIHRRAQRIRTDDGSGARTLTARDRGFYRPFAQDVGGRPLDTVIDWAGVSRTAIRTQKGQAILMTVAANSVLVNRRSDEYWDVEKHWVAGDHRSIVDERRAYLDQRMGVTG